MSFEAELEVGGKSKKRPSRNARTRREQYRRSEARCIQAILRCFSAMQHRGCPSTVLGQALGQALAAAEEAAMEKAEVEDAGARSTDMGQPAPALPAN